MEMDRVAETPCLTTLNIRERTPVAIGRRLTISSYRDRRRIDADVSRPGRVSLGDLFLEIL